MAQRSDTRIGWIMRHKLLLPLVCTLFLSLAGQTICLATTVTLQWDAVQDPGLAGYKVYYRADSSQQPFTGTGASQGNSPVDVPVQTTATIGGLDPSHAYSFAVTAYYASGVESTYSNIVSVPELVSPTISLTSPTNNATVSGTVSVTAGADDNVGVTKVEYYLNGALKATDTAAPYVYSWDTSTAATGAYTLTARAYDAAGNVGQSGSVSVTVVNDTTSPTVSVTAPANNSTVSGTVAISAGASDNVGVTRVEFYDNGTLVSATNVAPYSCTWNTATAANGSHTLTARAYDASNNTGQSTSVTVTVNNPDIIVPSVSMTAPANNATISGTVTVSASASDSVGVARVEFYLNGALQATSVSTPYSYTWNTAAMANGSHTLYAKAYDAANNVNQSANVTVTVNNPDTTAPIVSVTEPVNNATVGGIVAVTAIASDNVGVTRVRFYVNGSLKSTSTAAPYIYNWNTSSLANGVYTLYVRANDAANNLTQSTTVTVTVFNDTTVPTVSVTAPTSGATIGSAIVVTASSSDNVGVIKVEFYVNGALQSTDTTSPFAFNWNTAVVANGSYTLSAKAYDAAGNVGTSSNVSVTVFNDSASPTVSVTAPANGATVGGTVAVTAAASDSVGVSKVEFYVNGSLQSTDTSSPFAFNWNTAVIANGSYILSAKAYDAAGNVGTSSNVSVTVFNDSASPTVSVTAPANGATVGGTVAVTAAASDSAGVSKVEFYVNGVLQVTDTASPFAFNWDTTTVANGGSYTLSAKAYDVAGNVGTSSNVTVTVFNDAFAPTVSVMAPANGATVGGTVAVTPFATDNIGVTKVEFYVNGALKATDTTAPYSYSWDSTVLVNGSYTLSARAYDAAGNVGTSSSVTVTVFNDVAAPTISITAPANGATVGGTVAVTASASDNIGVNKVEFYVNGSLIRTVTAAPYSYSWDTKSRTNGNCVLTAKAYDSVGNVGTSSGITVTVFNDTTNPTVSITAPANGATIGGTVAVTAIASDDVGVSKVEFYLNGVLKATSTTATHSYNWDTTTSANGSHILSARAYDAAGNVGQSASITISVSNNVSPVTAALGDINGDGEVTIADALLTLKFAVGLAQPLPGQLLRGDVGPVVNGKSLPDGKIDITDALVIMRLVTGLSIS